MAQLWVMKCRGCGDESPPKEGHEARTALFKKTKGSVSECCGEPMDVVAYREPKKVEETPTPETLEELPEKYLPWDPEAQAKQKVLWNETLVWMKENPKLLDYFKQYALEADKTWSRFSISLLTERVRWEAPKMENGSPFKISNSYRRYIAIILVELYPQLSQKIWITKRRPRP